MNRVWQEKNSRREEHEKTKPKAFEDEWNNPIKFISASVKKVKMIFHYLGDKRELIGISMKMK